MHLSELQLKEIIDITNGKRVGAIVDVVVSQNGTIEKLILVEKRGRKFTKEEYVIYWNQIIKIGDDIILVDSRNK
jgi:YlmC/YmxH family sporulation protein